MTVSHTGDYRFYPNKCIDAISNELYDNYFIPVWKDVLKEIKPKVIVDVGCGNGVFSAYLLKEYDCSIIGMDGNQYALNKAMEKGYQKTLLVNDFSNDVLPLESHQYEFAINKDILEHLLDPMFLLREINRILKIGGMLLVHVPHHFPLYGRLKFLIKNDLDPFGYSSPNTKPWEYDHIRFFTYKSFTEMLSVAGFAVEKDFSYHFASSPFSRKPVKGLGKKIINTLAKKYPSEFCCAFTVLAKKTRDLDNPVENKSI